MSGPGTGGLSCGSQIWSQTVYPKWTSRLMLGEVELSSSAAAGNLYVSLVDSRYTPYGCHQTFESKGSDSPAWAYGSISSSWVAATLQLTGAAVVGSCFSGSGYPAWDWRYGSGSLSGTCWSAYNSVGLTASAMVFPTVAGTGYNIKNIVIWQTSSAPGANDDYLVAVFRKDDGYDQINIEPDGDNITVKFPSGCFTWGFKSY